jgi:2,4-dienoyl-CoA reductase-like NADH-dependent reductase (Old Yellow Enzyme family)
MTTATTATEVSDASHPAGVLLQPYRLSDELALPNRLLMAPMTRSMAGPGLVPTPASAEYYARRATAGLLVTEGTVVRPDGQGYPDTPGIWTDEQVAGWRRVTDRVHEEGGRIFAQLWHVGRVSHPHYLHGELPVAPSAVPLSGRVPRTEDLTYGTPRALAASEIPAHVEAFARGAANAREAGFDGVEVHGANGYLIDQFLHHHTNRRDDGWGGSPQGMSRFALAVVDAVSAEMGPGRTGIRLSPAPHMNMQGDPRDGAVFEHLLGELEPRRLAYVHLGIFDDSERYEELGGRRASEFLRRAYAGTLVGCGSYSPQGAAASLADDRFDLVALGRLFLANPDLVERLRDGQELRSYDPEMLKTLH